MNITFEGKTALVTGASQGIGREIALKLAKGGAKVYAVARNQTLLASLANESPQIHPIVLDLSDWAATSKALSPLPPIDLLVNNAALAILKPLTANTEPDIDAILAINVKALMHATQIVADTLKTAQRPGAIVNVSSQASTAGLANHSLYCASKGAVDAYTRAAALELGAFGIRVNAVNPTVIMTEMGRLGWSEPSVAEPMLGKIPLGRFGEVGEVVDAVLFLLSDKASLVTGICMPLDGGYLVV